MFHGFENWRFLVWAVTAKTLVFYRCAMRTLQSVFCGFKILPYTALIFIRNAYADAAVFREVLCASKYSSTGTLTSLFAFFPAACI